MNYIIWYDIKWFMILLIGDICAKSIMNFLVFVQVLQLWVMGNAKKYFQPLRFQRQTFTLLPAGMRMVDHSMIWLKENNRSCLSWTPYAQWCPGRRKLLTCSLACIPSCRCGTDMMQWCNTLDLSSFFEILYDVVGIWNLKFIYILTWYDIVLAVLVLCNVQTIIYIF